MNVEREREVFEKWYLYHYYSRSGLSPDGDIFKKYHDGEDWTYLYDAVFRAWVVWQASANRQGYKLAPVEPTQKMISAGMGVFSFPLDNGRFSDCELIFSYREMIGVCDD